MLLLALVLAQQEPPAYRPLRYEEDWSVLRDARGGDVFDPIKFIPLDEAEDVWLTPGGTIREQLEIHPHQDFGTGPEQDAYLLHRFWPYAEPPPSAPGPRPAPSSRTPATPRTRSSIPPRSPSGSGAAGVISSPRPC